MSKWDSFCNNWLPWLGMLFIVCVVVPLSGCQEGDEPPVKGEAPTAVVAPQEPPAIDSDAIPVPEPDSATVDPRRDPDWDCRPTGNSAIDDWKRDAKCGGKLEGE